MSETYKIHSYTVSNNQQIDSNCNAIEFVNDGDQDALVNGRALAVGASFSYYGLKGEKDITTYTIVFTGTPGADPKVVVNRKIYTGQ